jgi:hypothetical protein
VEEGFVLSRGKLEGACVCYDVLLVYACGCELEAVPPDDGLLVVGVGPYSVEVVVGAHC